MGLVRNLWNEIEVGKQHMIMLFSIYVLSQGLLLLLDVRLWDDMTNVIKDYNTLKDSTMQNGSYPLGFWINYWGWQISVPKVIFILYFIMSICVYYILKGMGLSEESCFWITALYEVMPFNDARITWICFGYSICLLSFYLGTLLIVKVHDTKGVKKVFMRILALALFACVAFWTQSLLVYFAVVLGYIVWREGVKRSFIYYMDLWLAPVVFKVVKECFAHPSGFYTGYNEISLWYLINAVWLTVLASFHTVGGALENALTSANAECFFMMLLIGFVIRDIGKKEYEQQSESSLQGGALGFIVLYLALFAYVTIRGKFALPLTGPEGRDLVLAPLGVAIILYYLPGIFRLRNTVRKTLYVMFFLLSIIHTNKIYMEYQLEEYHQQALIQLMRDNQEMAEAQNVIMYMNKVNHSNKVNTVRFYVLNGCAVLAYGNEKHFIMNGRDDIAHLVNNPEKWAITYNYNMHDWNDDYQYIDAEAAYVNRLNGKFWKLKFKELFYKESFRNELLKEASLVYQPLSRDESDKMIASYRAGKEK